jgi:hypothetical protein
MNDEQELKMMSSLYSRESLVTALFLEYPSKNGIDMA